MQRHIRSRLGDAAHLRRRRLTNLLLRARDWTVGHPATT
jgi:hypothetical protein